MNMVLAFPDLYEIGTSHFGIQILYHQLNQHADINAERAFAPAQDMEHLMRQNKIALGSLESQRPLSQFDVIGFSLLYELNYTNVLNMLDLGAIPLRWRQRNESHPIVIAGGPCVCNPEPMADFFDAMVFGDGEQVVLEMAELWLAWNAQGRPDKSALLEQWSRLEGVYVPRFYDVTYDVQGFQYLTPQDDTGGAIIRSIVPDLDQAYFPTRPIIPFGKPVHDRLRIEISRGCSRACRFCQAGMIYRPVRERSPEKILELVQQSLDQTGYDDLSLLSLSTGDYTCLGPLMESLMQVCQGDRVAVSLPSLRAGSLTPKLMALIRSIRKTGFTIAPEAGSQRLRNVVNKNITFEDVASTVRDAFQMGWKVIKLYFMIGLPTETDEDLQAIIEMVRQLKTIKGPLHRKGQLNVSITTFVPKPHTPFQWASQLSLEESKRKIEYLKTELNIKGVRLKWQHPEMSRLEGMLSRGDRRMSAVIEQAWKNGCTFDGWNDQFNFRLWEQAFLECGVDGDFFSTRQRSTEEPLPWGHMDARVDPGFLKHQWKTAYRGERVEDCRHGDCHGCGVCDFDRLSPNVFKNCPLPQDTGLDPERSESDDFTWFQLTYCKLGQARFFGHLELSNIFARAVRRAKIGVQYTKGFHPMPRLSFDDPLPLGMASEAEHMRIKVSARFGCGQIVELINMHLPEGIRVTDCRKREQERSDVEATTSNIQKFILEMNGIDYDADRLRKFKESDQWPFERTRHKGRSKSVDLKTAVKNITQDDQHNRLLLEIDIRSPWLIRPADVMIGVLQLSPEQVSQVMVTKLAVSVDSRQLKP